MSSNFSNYFRLYLQDIKTLKLLLTKTLTKAVKVGESWWKGGVLIVLLCCCFFLTISANLDFLVVGHGRDNQAPQWTLHILDVPHKRTRCLLCLRVWCLRYCYRSCIIRTDSTEKKLYRVLCNNKYLSVESNLPRQICKQWLRTTVTDGFKIRNSCWETCFFFQKVLEKYFLFTNFEFSQIEICLKLTSSASFFSY